MAKIKQGVEVKEVTDSRGRPQRKVLLHTGEGLTEQSQAAACDINNILDGYQRTGFIKHAKENAGRYDDITQQDFQEAMFIVAEANSMFESLPSTIRNRFENNPAEFLGFCQNPQNTETLKDWGVLIGSDGIDRNGAPSGAPVEPPPRDTTPPNRTPHTSSGGVKPE